MPLPPNTTPVPPSIFVPGMSSAGPKPTPLPAHLKEEGRDEANPSPVGDSFPQPHLQVHLNDVVDSGTTIFLTSINISDVFPRAVSHVQKALYVSPSAPEWHAPTVVQVTLIVRYMEGVAYTRATSEQDREIHLSSRYVASIAPTRRAHEIRGVLVHELVHCYQHNGQGRAPGGLIEGMADWVRLEAGLAPPHWRKGEELKKKWDEGYQHTAYFLQYLEKRFGNGTVRRINDGLRKEYEEKPFWTGLLGRPVEQLWDDYKKESQNLLEK
ncbi:BSP-domain-containing protein [Xylariaceae sp. FL0594]|nr:BSP-domain-containing protein [Xylariaceae sp. FL0594]